MMAEQIKDGGPAFPLHMGDVNGGMSLRDYFAAAAMQGIVASDSEPFGGYGDAATMARNAYKVADALLAERSKPKAT